MTQVALDITKIGGGPKLSLIKGNKDSKELASKTSPSTEMLLVGAIMVVLQILDGILTGIGVGHFGTSAEGNTVIRVLMEFTGHIPALILVKGFAIGIVGALVMLSARVQWVTYAMKGMILVYVTAAIIPWSMILYNHIF